MRKSIWSTVFENHPKCRIFQKLVKMQHFFGIFDELLPTQNVNVALLAIWMRHFLWFSNTVLKWTCQTLPNYVLPSCRLLHFQNSQALQNHQYQNLSDFFRERKVRKEFQTFFIINTKAEKRPFASRRQDSIFPSYTVFENCRKSLIQHCERSELRFHLKWTKVI